MGKSIPSCQGEINRVFQPPPELRQGGIPSRGRKQGCFQPWHGVCWIPVSGAFESPGRLGKAGGRVGKCDNGWRYRVRWALLAFAVAVVALGDGWAGDAQAQATPFVWAFSDDAYRIVVHWDADHFAGLRDSDNDDLTQWEVHWRESGAPSWNVLTHPLDMDDPDTIITGLDFETGYQLYHRATYASGTIVDSPSSGLAVTT